MKSLETIRGILLDIEGTTSSMMFVHQVMFPFVSARLEAFLAANLQHDDVQTACERIAMDAGHASLAAWLNHSANADPVQLVRTEVQRLMANDVKATGLKALQGLIWQEGFFSGELKGQVYADVLPAIRCWRNAGHDVRIYSSGSTTAQKLFFGHLEGAGDCLSLFSGHYDTTIGGKKDSRSYRAIADDWQLPPESLLFISDIADELTAARDAGFQVLASVRPGNSPLPDTLDIARITSFEQVN